MVSTEQYDPLSPDVHTDPYPYYEQFHASCPVKHYTLTEEQVAATTPEHNPFIIGPLRELWMLFAHEDIHEALTDYETFSSLREGIGLERTAAPNKIGMLNYSDPPHHGPQRAIVMQALAPKLVRLMEDRIAAYADGLIDGFIDRGEADIAAEYCDPLPGLMFCELFGAPSTDQPVFKKWSDAIISGYSVDPELQKQAGAAAMEMAGYFMVRINARREQLARGESLPEDLLTGLMTTEADGRCFDDTELVTAITLLIMAGNDTTTGAMGHAIHALCTHPEQLETLRRDPTLLPNAVEESLRFDSPAGCLFRTTTKDVTVAGVDIPAGAKVGIPFGSANRDPAVFERPNEFDITRTRADLKKLLTFGMGPHYCIGQALGRATVRIGLDRLLTRLPDFQLDPAQTPVRADILVARRFAHLHLRWTPPPA